MSNAGAGSSQTLAALKAHKQFLADIMTKIKGQNESLVGQLG